MMTSTTWNKKAVEMRSFYCECAEQLNRVGQYTVVLLALATLLANGEAIWAQQKPQVVDRAIALDSRIFDISDAGIHNPSAIAYSSEAGLFFLVQATTHTQYELFAVTPYAHAIASMPVTITSSSPIQMAFDEQGKRLLFLTPDELIAMPTAAEGLLPAASPIHYPLANWPFSDILSDIRGMTIDRATGHLYLLEGSTQTIVEIAPDAEASFSNATQVARFTLALPTSISPSGLTRNDITGTFYTLSAGGEAAYAFTASGALQSTYRLADAGLTSPQALVLAPTADSTDDPAALDLFIVDFGINAASQNTSIVELFLTPRRMVQAAAKTVRASLVATTDTSLYTPASPDPSGIAYLSHANTLMIGDGEVNEMAIYAGTSLFEITLSGALVTSYSSIVATDNPINDEPVGIAYAPPGGFFANAHLFLSDDTSGSWITVVDLGADGKMGTADDTRAQFSTSKFVATDPEGLTYDSWNNALFLADGINEEIYRIAPGDNGIFDGIEPEGDDQVTHFDVSSIGIRDPEAIEFDSDTGHLYIMSLFDELLAETLLDGTLVQYIDVSAANLIRAAGLAHAPSSTNPIHKNLYIIDRAIDNNSDPYENDGKLYEMSLPVGNNLPPLVHAGPDQTILHLSTVSLAGTVHDDGKGNPPGAVTTTWSQVSGPGDVIFVNATAPATTATFSEIGTYVLRLSASDNQFVSSDTIAIFVVGTEGESTIERRISTSDDDAEEDGDTGSVSVSNGDLELGFDGKITQWVGLRFGSIDIPRGATILNAYIQFTADDTIASADTAALTIRGEAVDNAEIFTTNRGNLSSRPTTTATQLWQPPDWTTAGEAAASQRTVDLAAIIQEIVHRDGWNSGNSLALLISGTGTRRAVSYNGSMSQSYSLLKAPLLRVTFSVGTSVNPIIVVNDSYRVNEDELLTVAAPGVLENDNRAGLPSVTAVTIANPRRGTLGLNGDGSFVYRPAINFNGIDTFTYRVESGNTRSSMATVIITVDPVMDAPVATNDNRSVAQNSVLTVIAPGILANDLDFDGDLLTAAKVTDPANGALTLNGDGSFVYVPAVNFSGVDTFTYKANDGSFDSNIATVIISVGPVNNAPIATDDNYRVDTNEVLAITTPGVLGNDQDDNENLLIATRISSPAHGTLTLNSDGSFVYIPAPNFKGVDSFTYQANDGSDDSNVAIVTIIVEGVDDGDEPRTPANDTLFLPMVED